MNPKNDIIRFILDGELKQISFEQDDELRPDTSLLHYLRGIGHTGVKEGCGEGDCGACTVVVARPQGTKLLYQSINSCLVLLPMIHGCQVITVHNLKKLQNGNIILHPVQKALIDHHGSQCGYCTPGIVMSMFAMWKNHAHLSTEMIKEGLSGNLCRCTGYQPIIDAMMSLSGKSRKDHLSASEASMASLLSSIREAGDSIAIHSGGMLYLKPASLEEALALKEKHPDTLLISGATDIGVAVNKGKKELKACLDISSLDELRSIRNENASLHFGPCTSLSELGKAAEKDFPALYEMIGRFGSLQIRNMASAGGNIASASPIGDLLPVLMAYGCELEIQSKSSKRHCLLEDFVLGYHKVDLRRTEMITEIRIPLPAKGVIIRSYKVSKRKDVDISTVASAFRISLDHSGVVTEAGLFFGGMAAKTARASKAETFLLGKKWTESIALEASRIIGGEFTPISDARSSAEGRKILSENLLIKFWEDTKHLSP